MKKTNPSEIIQLLERVVDSCELSQPAENFEEKCYLVAYNKPKTKIAISSVTRWIERLDWDRYALPAEDEWVFELALGSLKAYSVGEASEIVDTPSIDGIEQSALYLIYETLRKFRGSTAEDRWDEIDFLKSSQSDFWSQLCVDLDEAYSSIAAQNWKAATVVSASVMEALLHWWLRGKETTSSNMALSTLINLASDKHGLFKSSSNDQKDAGDEKSKKEVAMCAANYRNLIHADKATRLKATCSRATAWTAFGATLMVTEAIGKKISPNINTCGAVFTQNPSKLRRRY
jgi:hypothetical protein